MLCICVMKFFCCEAWTKPEKSSSKPAVYNIVGRGNARQAGERARTPACVRATEGGIENATAIILRLLRVKIGPMLGLLYCTAVLSPMSFVITNYPN